MFASPRRGGQRCHIERVEQHTGVDPGGRRGRSIPERRVAGHLVLLAHRDAEHLSSSRGVALRQPDERVDDLLTYRCQSRERERRQVERSAAARGALGLGGWQQDEHARDRALDASAPVQRCWTSTRTWGSNFDSAADMPRTAHVLRRFPRAPRAYAARDVSRPCGQRLLGPETQVSWARRTSRPGDRGVIARDDAEESPDSEGQGGG